MSSNFAFKSVKGKNGGGGHPEEKGFKAGGHKGMSTGQEDGRGNY